MLQLTDNRTFTHLFKILLLLTTSLASNHICFVIKDGTMWISSLANSIRVLANMEDPIGCILKKTEVADGLVLEKTSSPLGVLLIVFESRPDALVQIASLAIRSGNGLLLKGGKEAKQSNAILHKIITGAIPDSVGKKVIGLVTSREEIPDLLKLDDVIDLVFLEAAINLYLKSRILLKFQFWVMLMEFAMFTLTSLLRWIWQSKLFWMQK
ncbi:hypothetical protein SLA2020_412300 [Shorea laevis]